MGKAGPESQNNALGEFGRMQRYRKSGADVGDAGQCWTQGLRGSTRCCFQTKFAISFKGPGCEQSTSESSMAGKKQRKNQSTISSTHQSLNLASVINYVWCLERKGTWIISFILVILQLLHSYAFMFHFEREKLS